MAGMLSRTASLCSICLLLSLLTMYALLHWIEKQVVQGAQGTDSQAVKNVITAFSCRTNDETDETNNRTEGQ